MRPLEAILGELEAGLAEIRQDHLPPAPTPTFHLVAPGDSVQAALDDAVAGAEIRLARGATYQGNLVIRRPVTLTTDGLQNLGPGRITPEMAPWLGMLRPANGSPLIDIVPGVTDVRLDAIACDPGNLNDVITIGHADGSQTGVSQQPERIELSRIFLQAGQTQTPKRGIGLHARHVTIRGSHIGGIKRAGQDTQAIGGWNGEGTYVIEDNFLEAAGETIMFGGADPTIPGVIPSDITIRGNAITKDLTWRGSTFTVKNLLELKAARRVLIAGNQFSNCWNQGHGGYVFMFTVQSQNGQNPEVIVEDVTVERNEIRNVGAGFNILGYAQINTSRQSRNFLIRENWIQIDQGLGAQAWFLFLSREPREVAVYHNTIESTSTNAILKQEGPPVQAFTFTDNLVPRCGTYGFTGNVNGTAQHRGVGITTYLPDAVIRDNAFGSFPTPSNLPNNLHRTSLQIAPLVVDGFGTGEVANYGRTR